LSLLALRAEICKSYKLFPLRGIYSPCSLRGQRFYESCRLFPLRGMLGLRQIGKDLERGYENTLLLQSFKSDGDYFFLKRMKRIGKNFAGAAFLLQSFKI